MKRSNPKPTSQARKKSAQIQVGPAKELKKKSVVPAAKVPTTRKKSGPKVEGTTTDILIRVTIRLTPSQHKKLTSIKNYNAVIRKLINDHL